MVIVSRVLALLTVVVLFAGCAGNVAFKKGERYEVAGDWDRAVIYYRQALQEDPDNIEYRTRLSRIQESATSFHLERSDDYLKAKNAEGAIHEAQQAMMFAPDNDRAQQLMRKANALKERQQHISAGQGYLSAGRPNEALNEFYKVLDTDPENAEAKQYIERITKQRMEDSGGEEELALASDEPITLSFKDAKLKEVFEFLSKLSGISILFDEDVKDQPVTVFAKDVSFTQALKLLLATNKLFMKKIAADAIIIIPKTKSKLDQYQDLQVRTFYLNNILAKDMVNIIRTMLETRKVIINEQLNAITLRETPDKLKLCEKLIEANDRKDSEVIIDVAVMSVDRTDSLKYGLNLPKSVTGQYVPPNAVIPAPGAVPDLSTNVLTSWQAFRQGIKKIDNNVFFSYPSVTADWLKSQGDTETLTSPQIRVINKKPAKILIGSRVPVQTGTVVASAGQTTATFEYRDVGIKLTVEPYIGIGNDVSLKTTLEVSTLGSNVQVGTTATGQPNLLPGFDTTTAETTLNLTDGETVLIGGLLENKKSTDLSGIAGLSDVPILGKIFSTNTIGPNRKREIVMTLTPHIVRAQEAPAMDIASFWSGTEEAYDTKPLFEEKKQRLSVPETEEEQQAKKQAAAPTPAQPSGPAAEGEVPEPGQPAKPAPRKIGRVGSVSFAPEIAPVDVGQEITIDVMATDLDTVFEAPLSIIYNPKLVDFVKADEGGFMKVDGKPTSFTATANDKVGYIDIFLTRLGKVPGIAGSGKLFSLTFKGKSPGISPLVFKQNTLKDTDGRTVPTDLKTGTLYVK